jgi:diguanylate cyclase (GGDEF)-like protein
VRRRLQFQSLTPIVAMVLLFVGVLAFSLNQTMREADAVDSERTQLAVAAAVKGHINQIAIVADDNGIWDDATRAIYGHADKTDFLWGSWGVSTAESKNYDTAMVIDDRGRALYAYRRGRPVRVDLATYDPAFLAIIDKAARTGSALGGIVESPDGLILVGASPILPTSRELDGLVPASGPYRLVLTKPVTQDMADAIGGALMLKGVTIGPSAAITGEGILVENALQKPVAAVRWIPARPGLEAIKRALPWIAMAIFIHLIIAIFVSKLALRAIRDLAGQALVDSLSKLPNRRALRGELTRRLRAGEHLALAMIDLDGFKAINDNYGHSVGDRLIKSVAQMLNEMVGDKGTVARLGGDEFAVMIPGLDSVTVLQMTANDILSKLSKPFRIDERTVLVGASIGLASASLSDLDTAEIMRRADVAMYAAKRAGKMRLTWYDEMLDQKRATAQLMESELRAAIEADAFEIVYQPVIDSDNRQIVGAEALLRWESPTRGRVDPNEFVPVAEETGLIDRIGMMVLRRACSDALAWRIQLAVNISSAQLRNPDFPMELSRVLEETGYPPEKLELEIPESYVVCDPEAARRVLQSVAELGVALSLDNYGVGFVSMRFLSQFPFSKIKLDRQLVSSALHSEAARTALHASISVARVYGMAVGAEGVETGAQEDLMRVAGCIELQGWLYARPMDGEGISAHVRRDYAEHETRYLRLV